MTLFYIIDCEAVERRLPASARSLEQPMVGDGENDATEAGSLRSMGCAVYEQGLFSGQETNEAGYGLFG